MHCRVVVLCFRSAQNRSECSVIVCVLLFALDVIGEKDQGMRAKEKEEDSAEMWAALGRNHFLYFFFFVRKICMCNKVNALAIVNGDLVILRQA